MNKDTSEDTLEILYQRLVDFYGPRGWWPVTPPGEYEPEYTGGPQSEAQRFEVWAGAILTQNTAWKNASAAIRNLNRAGLLSPGKISRMEQEEIARLIRSAGYYNQKAARLKIIASFFLSGKPVTRQSLLRLKGVGRETADCILLYACNQLHFVVDAYTRRILSRLGLIEGGEGYREIKDHIQGSIHAGVKVYQEYHALLVEHGKRYCRSKPRCRGCVLASLCHFSPEDI